MAGADIGDEGIGIIGGDDDAVAIGGGDDHEVFALGAIKISGATVVADAPGKITTYIAE